MNQKTPKSALITGASNGIGKALAEEFAAAGHTVIVSARSEARLQALASQWRQQYGVAVHVLPSDLSQPGAALALAREVKALGLEIDFLVNNAGVGLFGEFEHNDGEAEVAMMRLNMESLVLLTREFLPVLKARQGRIMNVASTAAFQPGPYMAVYYATKAFVLSFSEAIAEELSGSGVKVTALCPGPTASGFQDLASMQDSSLVKGKRLPTSEAVAKAGFRAMQRGQRVYIPGVMNRLMAWSVRFTPRRVVTAMVRYLSRPVAA